jgi:putative tricarboxylic transport membrane protein
MKKADLISSSLIFLLGVFILRESWNFHFWGPEGPAEGFFPLLLSTLLIGMSGAHGIVSYYRSSSSTLPGTEVPFLWKKVTLYAAGLLGYSFLFDFLGFFVSSTLFLILILRLAEKWPWAPSIWITGVSVLGSYLLFHKILMVPLPPGILEWR